MNQKVLSVLSCILLLSACSGESSSNSVSERDNTVEITFSCDGKSESELSESEQEECREQILEEVRQDLQEENID